MHSQRDEGGVRKPSILIVSYLFPPMGGIAVQRALSLARYLPQSGYDVHVLKARNAAGPVYDSSLLKHVPDSISIHSAFTPEIPFELRQRIWKWISHSTGSVRLPGSARPAGGSWQRGLLRECSARSRKSCGCRFRIYGDGGFSMSM